MKTLKSTILFALMSISILASQAKEIKLTVTQAEMVVDVTPEKAWEIINSYGDVGSYHSGIVLSKSLNNSKNEGYMGCERQCTIENGKKDVVANERIIEFVDGKYYRYEVTRTENFPIQKFYNTFGVKVNDKNQTVIYVKSEFRMDPGFITGMAKGKLKKGNRDALVAYKHYMETGEKNADPKMLKKKYKNS